MEEDRYAISSVQKALRVLSLFISDDSGHSFSDVARTVGPDISRSNIVRILATLKGEGYLGYDEEEGLYYLGPVFLMSNLTERSGILSHLVERDLRQAAQESGMIVHFTVLSAGELKIAFRCFPRSSMESLALASMDDEAVPVNATGAGKVYAAFADADVAERLVAQCPFRSYGKATITDRAVFSQVVEKVRNDGYALNVCEHEEFLCCLSRPVYSSGGHLAGALSFSGLKDMFQGERYQRMFSMSQALAQTLSRRLGHDS